MENDVQQGDVEVFEGTVVQVGNNARDADYVMDATEARERTDRLRSSIEDNAREIAELYAGRAWIALGYGTWEEYFKGEFTTTPKLPPKQRAELSLDMQEQGMPAVAISVAFGVHKGTTTRDLRAAEAATGREAPATAVGLRGNARKTRNEPRPAGRKARIPEMKVVTFEDRFEDRHVELREALYAVQALVGEQDFGAWRNKLRGQYAPEYEALVDVFMGIYDSLKN